MICSVISLTFESIVPRLPGLWPPCLCGSIKSQCWMAGNPPVRLLISVGNGEQAGLLEGLADDLQTDGQAGPREPAGDREAGQAGEVEADRINVAQVHGERIR